MGAIIPAVLVDDLFGEGVGPGSYRFYRFGDEPTEGPPAGINFRCPCGCEQVGGLALRQYGEVGPVWTWNGSREKPTCTPSVGFYGMNPPEQGHHWHGFLTDGEWREC